MGKGDKKSKKGKRFRHSYGKTRLHQKKKVVISSRKIEVKPKEVEQKKVVRHEHVVEKPPVIETHAEELAIKVPETVEIKEEIKPTETQEKDITQVPEIAAEPLKEEIKKEEVKLEEVQKEISKEEAPKEEAKKEEPKEKEIKKVEEAVKPESKKVETKKEKKPKKKEEVKEEPKKAAPKKRGRPKKKKDE